MRREHGTPSSPRQVSAHRRTGLLSWPWRTILRTYHPGCCPGSWAGPTPPGYEYYDKISQEAAQSLLDQAKDRLGRECETQLLVGKTEEVVTESLSHADLLILARDGYRCTQTGVMLIGKPPADNSPVVDHITPHRGDEALFWDANNLQSVSKRWHDTVKRGIERGEGGAKV